MLYIVTALKPEAQAFVDYHKLKKSKLNNFTIFQNQNIKLIISGIGVEKSRLATQTLINHFDITDDDIYLNAGICGANAAYAIGSLLEIGSLHYNGADYHLNTSKHHLTCLDAEATNSADAVVDMESYGFYDAVIHNPAIKHFHIFKIVSDHFEPQKVTKERTKSLLFNVIDDINKLIKF
jgi:hypothetical protein